MIKNIFLTVIALILIRDAFGQKPSIELMFTAIDSVAYVQLDSIKVMNRSQGGDTILYYPDTMPSIYYVGIPEITKNLNAFQIFQIYPNPVADQTTVSLYVPQKDKVSIKVSDILGRVFVKSERVLDKGKHSFRFIPGGGNLHFFTATWQGQRSSIKILQTNPGSGSKAALEYIGYESSSLHLKATTDILNFPFRLGDELLFIGYYDTLQSGMLDSPEESGDYIFQFASNIPCLGTPTVEYEGQVYNTIQIFSQCWLKENLNVGEMIQGELEQSDNGTIEKYCINNQSDSCTKYGGLYQWNEMMQYTTQQGTQGICPPGWHLPTDEELKVLEGVVDSQYGIGDIAWDDNEYRGFNAGTNLKTTSGWHVNGNGTDLFGFSGKPGGYRINYGLFYSVGHDGFWWTSSEYNEYFPWYRSLYYYSPEVYRNYSYKESGFSVRCLRDY